MAAAGKVDTDCQLKMFSSADDGSFLLWIVDLQGNGWGEKRLLASMSIRSFIPLHSYVTFYIGTSCCVFGLIVFT